MERGTSSCLSQELISGFKSWIVIIYRTVSEWKWQIKRKSCWVTVLVLRTGGLWPLSRFSTATKPLERPVESLLASTWVVSWLKMCGWRRHLQWLGGKWKVVWAPKEEEENQGNETFSENPYFISLKGFVEAGLCGRRQHMWASPLTLCLCCFFDVPPLAAFAQTNLQSSLSSQLPLDPASHASAALPSPNKPLMRPNLPSLISCPFFKFPHLKTHYRPVILTQTTHQSSYLTLASPGDFPLSLGLYKI